MKKCIRMCSARVLVLLLGTLLIACDKQQLDGVYQNKSGSVKYEFYKDTVILTVPNKESFLSMAMGDKSVYEGTYKIKDDTITITLVDGDGNPIDEQATIYDGALNFEDQGNGTIIIGNFEYKLVTES